MKSFVFFNLFIIFLTTTYHFPPNIIYTGVNHPNQMERVDAQRPKSAPGTYHHNPDEFKFPWNSTPFLTIIWGRGLGVSQKDTKSHRFPQTNKSPTHQPQAHSAEGHHVSLWHPYSSSAAESPSPSPSASATPSQLARAPGR